MQLRLLTLIGPLCLIFAAHAQTNTVASIRQQIDASNEAASQAIRTSDSVALEKLWSPHLIVNSPANTVLTRDQVIAAMKRGGLNYTSRKVTVEAFSVFGDTAIEMGHEDFVMATGPAAGKPLVRRFTDVFQRNDDRWVLIARQATILDVDASMVYARPSAAPLPQSH